MALNLHMGTVIVAAVTAFATPASAYDPDTTGNGLQSSIARGGRLYDNWYVEIKERAPAVHRVPHSALEEPRPRPSS